jgi:hypothetical protein
MRDLLKSVQSLLSQRQALAEEEKRTVEALNQVLPQIGYRIVPIEADDRHQRPTPPAPAVRSLKCPQCSRRFSQPLHLGRHLSASHGKKPGNGRKAASTRKPVNGKKRKAA